VGSGDAAVPGAPGGGRVMLRLPAVALTTRHLPSAYPWQCQRGLPALGPVIGLDQLAGGDVFAFDPFAYYGAGVLTSPNVVVLGQLGKGKSALVKSWLMRESLHGRRCVVLDPKGEYGPLADELGLDRLRLCPGGEARLNPLDAGPGASGDRGQLARWRAELVGALAEAGLGRPLHPAERAAVGAAVAELGTAAVLGDVVAQLGAPSAAMAARLAVPVAELAREVRPAALELRRLLDGDLAGMFDAPTSVALRWDGPGLVVDLSAVFGSAALAAVMVCAGTWLAHAVAAPGAPPTILVLDETWSVLRLTAVTRWLQSTAKLARAYGVALVVVAHRVSDFSAQADDGAEAAKQARGLLADLETRIVYAQAPGETEAARTVLGLTDAEAELVAALPAHRALWLVGGRAAVVDHVLSAAERAVCDTDARMSGGRR